MKHKPCAGARRAARFPYHTGVAGPGVREGLLYMTNDVGVVVCLRDMKTGERVCGRHVWSGRVLLPPGRGRPGCVSSAGAGETIVVKAGREPAES